MDKMQGDVIQLNPIMIHAVEEAFMGAPIVLVLPVIYELLDVRQMGPVFPT
jgi:hypothetical protein